MHPKNIFRIRDKLFLRIRNPSSNCRNCYFYEPDTCISYTADRCGSIYDSLRYNFTLLKEKVDVNIS